MLLAATLVVMACLPSGSSLTLLLFVLFSTTISAVSNLVGILPAESFPTDIRSLGVGFATAMSRLGAAVSTGLLPVGAGAVGNASHLIAPGDSVVGWFCCDLAMGTRN
ncbi:major facilitator superfamily protein [Escherichia coli]|uniref:Major facilitator superfamily protein n=1 Tax=Escherichia coli TaxID=562 RepID=A0A2X1KN71_ECOLX|nr:major facilitator superfamily protein [Escherichia coli]